MEELTITAGGRGIADAVDRIRRYCGLPWSGGAPETWAWHYYDAVPTAHDDAISAVDVLCAGALHPGLSKADLAFFRDRADDISGWLADVPTGSRLWEVPDEAIDHLADLPGLLPDASITLLSKVLHRKRPHLIPLLDRHIIDWYRPVTGKRLAADAWGSIIRAMREDEGDPERRLLYSVAFGDVERELWPDAQTHGRPALSWIRCLDIAIWMGSR